MNNYHSHIRYERLGCLPTLFLLGFFTFTSIKYYKARVKEGAGRIYIECPMCNKNIEVTHSLHFLWCFPVESLRYATSEELDSLRSAHIRETLTDADKQDKVYKFSE